jgi:hypothetical protein
VVPLLGGFGEQSGSNLGRAHQSRSAGVFEHMERPTAIDVEPAMILLLALLAMGSNVDRSGVDAVVKRHREQIRYCYEKRLPQRPTLEGRVVMRLALTRDGTLTSATIDGTSTLNDATVEACLLVRFAEWTWPPGPWDHDIIYPLRFTQVRTPPRSPVLFPPNSPTPTPVADPDPTLAVPS